MVKLLMLDLIKISVKTYYRVSKILNSKVKVIVDKKRIRPKYSEVERLKCNTSKLRKNIKWKPKHNLEKGLKKLISWLREKDNLKNYKPNQYNI